MAMIIVMCAAAAPMFTAAAPAPSPTLNKAPQPWVGMAIMFVLLAMVIFVSLMPSKRSHQD